MSKEEETVLLCFCKICIAEIVFCVHPLLGISKIIDLGSCNFVSPYHLGT